MTDDLSSFGVFKDKHRAMVIPVLRCGDDDGQRWSAALWEFRLPVIRKILANVPKTINAGFRDDFKRKEMPALHRTSRNVQFILRPGYLIRWI